MQAVCWPQQAFPGLVGPVTNKTATLEAKRRLERSFKIDAAYLKQLKASVNYNQISDISLTIKNAAVLEYSDGDLYAALPKRQQVCTQSITSEVALKRKVLTVLQVLRADVSYHVVATTQAGASASIPETVLKGLQLNLGGSVVNTNDSTVIGDQLVWGIYPDQIGVRALPGAINTMMGREPKLGPEDRRNLTKLRVIELYR